MSRNEPRERNLADTPAVVSSRASEQRKWGDGLIWPNVFPVTVDYSLSLAEMIAAGKYDLFTDMEITPEHFPIRGSGKVEVNLQLAHFYELSMPTWAVEANLGRRGLRPATLPELLAFGAKYPDTQRQFPIVALGSVWNSSGFHMATCLDGDDGKRWLHTVFCDNDDRVGRNPWGTSHHFLAVAK